MILVISAVQALLAQLTSSQSSPHSALLTSKTNGTVLAASYVPSTHPFPPASLADRDQDERNRVYAAVGGSCWTDEHGYANQITPSANDINNDDQSTQPQQVLKVETELGRLVISAVGTFLLILVGSHVAPWTVLEKKVQLAREELQEPLNLVGH